MTNFLSTAAARPTLGFALEGLSGREEFLFKSIVRLLDHRTVQHWVYQPDAPDLRVCRQGDAQESSRTETPLQLTLSATPQQLPHRLSFPLRADVLEAELNLLGAEHLQAQRGTDVAMRLLRWPSPDLVDSAARLKLASLMVGGPFTLARLQHRSGLPLDVCAAYTATLRQAGMAVPVAIEAAATPSAPVVEPAAVRRAPVVTEPSRTGLLARIRHRLGMLSPVGA